MKIITNSCFRKVHEFVSELPINKKENEEAHKLFYTDAMSF